MKPVEISVFEVVGGAICAWQVGGEKVFKRIKAAVMAGHGAEVSFRNVAVLTPSFLNTAIGQMYGSFTDDQIAMVTFPDISIDDAALLDRVVKNAKAYFINRWEVAK